MPATTPRMENASSRLASREHRPAVVVVVAVDLVGPAPVEAAVPATEVVETVVIATGVTSVVAHRVKSA